MNQRCSIAESACKYLSKTAQVGCVSMWQSYPCHGKGTVLGKPSMQMTES